MYWLDTVILCVLAGSALMGALTGFLWFVFWIISVSVGLYCTVACNDVATVLVERHLMTDASPGMAQGVAYLLVFVVVFVLFLILTLMLHQLVRKANLQWLNRLVGAVFVTAICASIMGVVFLVLNAVPGSREVVERSKIAPVLVAGIQSLIARIPEDMLQPVEEKMGQALQTPIKDQSPGPQINKTKTPRLEIPVEDQILEKLGKPKK